MLPEAAGEDGGLERLDDVTGLTHAAALSQVPLLPEELKSQKGKFVKGKQTGSWTWWHPNGQRAEEGDYLVGRKAGQWVSWYESGAKKEEGIYHNGMKNGVWTYYNDDKDNTVEKTERWENGGIVEENGKAVVPEKDKP